MEFVKDLLVGADLLYHPVPWTVDRQLHVRTPVRFTSLIFFISLVGQARIRREVSKVSVSSFLVVGLNPGGNAGNCFRLSFSPSLPNQTFLHS